MKTLKMITLLLVLVPALATIKAKSPKKPYKLPVVFSHARYVYVESTDGQVFDPHLDPYNRKAIADIDDALYHWNRYILTTRRSEADLIFVVRKGLLAAAKGGVRVGSGPQGPPADPRMQDPANPRMQDPDDPRIGSGNAVGVGGEVGPPDDLLEVYRPNPYDAHGTLLWRHTLADGLNPPALALFKQLRDEVERTYPDQKP